MDDILRNLVLVFLVAGGVLHLFQRLRLPAVVGLLVAGVLIGPHGLGVLRDRGQIEQLADIGILLLMFSIGLDFTRERLDELVYAAGMGAAQMLWCIVVSALLAAPFVERVVEAVFLGFLVAHTSSTLMLKLFLDRGELSSPPVRLGLGISITQDLSVVLMLLAVPIMSSGQFDLANIAWSLLRAALVLAVGVILAQEIIPFWMHHVLRSRSRELFLIFLVVVCLGTAWTTLAAGLSIGLGAFLAGLAIAESGYSHHTLSEVTPFRDLLISVFFISIGMLLEVGALPGLSGVAAASLLVVLVIKFLSGFGPVWAWGYPIRVATVVGLAIAQIGEFSFVLAHTGHQAGLVQDAHYQLFLMVAIASMAVSPFLVAVSPRVGEALAHWPVLRWLDQGRQSAETDPPPPMSDHIVIAGYGLNGRNLATALQTLNLPFAVVEMNPDTVQAARRRGEPVYFGDCGRVDILEKLHITTARGLVLAISDPQATRRAVQVARLRNPQLHIIARTRYMSEIDPLRQLGANHVIAEEFETSLEVLTAALRLYDTPKATIDSIIDGFRANAYHALRAELTSTERRRLLNELIPGIEVESHTLAGDSPAVGRSLRELDLRARTGATLLAVQRNGTLIPVPAADWTFQPQDVLVLAGNDRQISAALQLLTGTHTHPSPVE